MGDQSLFDSKRWKVSQPSGAQGMWQDFEFGVPGKYACFFEDFTNYVAGDWTVTAAGGGTAAMATSAPTVGGHLLVTTANVDDDLVSLQKVGHAWVPTAGSTIYFEAMMQASEATQIDIITGLIATDTTPLSNANGIHFIKNDGDTNLNFVTTSSSTSSTANAIGTFAATTYFKLGFKVTGTSNVDYWINDVKIGSFTSNIPTVPLRVTLAHQDGDTGAALGALTSSWDYIFVAQSRPHYAG